MSPADSSISRILLIDESGRLIDQSDFTHRSVGLTHRSVGLLTNRGGLIDQSIFVIDQLGSTSGCQSGRRPATGRSVFGSSCSVFLVPKTKKRHGTMNTEHGTTGELKGGTVPRH
jgi:hypothetical protein